MIASIVSAAVWAVIASLALSLVLGAVVFGVIVVFRPAAATRQALWSLALGAAGIAPVVILAVMLVRGALLPPDVIMSGAAPVRANVHVSIAPPAGAHADTAEPDGDDARPAGPPPSLALHIPQPPDVAPILAQIIVFVWALGAAGGLAGLARSLMRVRGLKLRSSPLDGDLATELPWLTTIKGREIYLRLSYETETPIAVGFRRPVILIPTEMATAAGLTSIEPLVMHEYAHLARYDDWTNLVQRAIERVFWFNPLVWILGRRIALEREVAADEAVVARTHDAKNYASALWRMAQEMRMPEHVVVAPGAMLTRKQISVRIERLLEDAAPAGRRFGAAGFAVAALAFSGVAALAATAPPVMLAQSDDAIAVASPSPVPHVIIRKIVADPAPTAHPAPHPLAVATTKAEGVTDAAESAAARAVVTAIVTGVGNSALKDEHDAQLPVPASPPALRHSDDLQRADLQRLKDLGPQIGADVARQVAAAARHGRDDEQQSTRGPVTRDMIANCMGCDFTRRDLHGLDLSGVSLVGIDFTRSNLSGVNLGKASLKGVDFTHADLTGASFRSAKLTGVDLNHTRLDDADFSNAELTGVDLTGASMNGTNTTGIHLLGSTLP